MNCIRGTWSYSSTRILLNGTLLILTKHIGYVLPTNSALTKIQKSLGYYVQILGEATFEFEMVRRNHETQWRYLCFLITQTRNEIGNKIRYALDRTGSKKKED